MGWWHELKFLTRKLNRKRAEQELEEEIRTHLQMETQEQIESGLAPEDARYAAQRNFGGTLLATEKSRDVWGFRTLEMLWQDLRFGVRMLMKKPGFTVIAVFTLALGIGASTAIFSAVNPILFEPLPYPQAEQVTMVWDKRDDGMRDDVTFGTYREVVERSSSFDAIAALKPWQPTMIEPTERLDGQRVSASYFRALGVSPVLGRDFEPSDDRLNSPRVTIIAYGLWQRRFGGEQAIIGRQITLNDDSYTVIGVMPPTLENVLAPSAQLWAPLQYDMSQGRAWGHHLRMVGRLRSGIQTDQAGRELDMIAHTPVSEFPRQPWASVENGFIVNSLQDDVTRSIKPVLLVVLGAVLLVLTIASVNVTNLLLARGAQRRGEFAVRAALGAGQRRLIRQLLTESLLLATLGGALGMVVAQFGVGALVALSPPGLPRVSAIAFNGTVFAFGMAITTLIGLMVGLIPALHVSGDSLRVGLQQNSGRTAGNHQLTRRTLVVAEVAIAVVLLVGSGLLLRSLQRLFAVAPGFETSHLLTMQVQTSGHRFDDDSTTHRFFTDALDAVRRVPGVTAAAFTSQLPLSGESDKYGVRFESSLNGNPEGDGGTFRYAVSPGYFEAMGIPLRQGRLLDVHDMDGAPPVVLINESFAKLNFPGQDPIGQRMHIGPTDRPWYTIVGVVGDVKQTSLAVSQSDGVYITPTQSWFADKAMSLVVRTQSDAAALAPAIRDAIWSIDRNQPIVRVATMDDLLAASAAERRFALILFEVFGIVALVLAAIGIYGVLSGNVTERRREIGVRLALGAQRREVLSLILRQGVKLTLNGVGLGLLAAWALTRLLTKLLYSVSATDPLIFGSVGCLLTVVALLACYLPARRATKVDPLEALRPE
jgi:putative ABC transport system permease protein